MNQQALKEGNSVSALNGQISGVPYGSLSKTEVLHELGQFLETISKSKARQNINLASFMHWVKPAVLHRQYKFLKLSSDIEYTGYVLWAWVDDQTLHSYMTEPRFSLKPMNWNEGENLIVVDWFTATNVLSQIRSFYKHIISNTNIGLMGINICIRDEQGNVIRTNKRKEYGY
jgi:hemolysin-activating ACP:hemolysin acyltransferase